MSTKRETTEMIMKLTSCYARCSSDMVSFLEAWGWLQSTEDCPFGRISGWMVQQGTLSERRADYVIAKPGMTTKSSQSVQKPMKLWRHRVQDDMQMNTKRSLHRNLNNHNWAMVKNTISSNWCYHADVLIVSWCKQIITPLLSSLIIWQLLIS